MHFLRWLTVFCLTATAAAQTYIQGSGCTNQLGANKKKISCTDASIPQLTDNYFVTLKVYDYHNIKLDCGGCGKITPIRGTPISSSVGVFYYAWMVDHLTNQTTKPVFTATSTATPSTWLLTVIRVLGPVTIDTTSAVLSGGLNMSTTLNTAAAAEPVYGWCNINNNDQLTPGSGFAQVGPTTYRNNLIEYGVTGAAGHNTVNCTTPYSYEAGAITAWALVGSGSPPIPPNPGPAPSFTLKVSGATQPNGGMVTFTMPPTAYTTSNPCATIVSNDGTASKNGVYVNYCIYPITQATPTPATFPNPPVTTGPAFNVTYSDANINNSVIISSANPSYSTIQADNVAGYYLLFHIQAANNGVGRRR